jgi:hypothetical protein
MALIDFILNLAGVLLWLSWRATHFDPLARSRPASLIGTLKPTEVNTGRRWHFLGALGVLLLMRSWLYWQIGSAVDWTPSIGLGAIAISFRSDYFSRMLLYSVLSFGTALTVLYSWMLLLSAINASNSEALPVQRVVRLHLGRLDRWHPFLKAVVPMLVVALAWIPISLLLAKLNVIPAPVSNAHRFQQAIIIGCGTYLTWKYLLGALLAAHLVSSYVYFGSHGGWEFVATSGNNLLRLLEWVPLRFGKVNFAPIVGIAAVFLASEAAERGLTYVYRLLPLAPPG